MKIKIILLTLSVLLTVKGQRLEAYCSPGALPLNATSGTQVTSTDCDPNQEYCYHSNISPEMTASQITAAIAAVQSFVNAGATLIAGATNSYNCHGFAWLGTTDGWLNDPWPLKYCKTYLTSKYGAPTASQISWMDAKTTPVVIYYNASSSHSGQYEGSGMIESKWGLAGRYEHTFTNCPYYPNWEAYY